MTSEQTLKAYKISCEDGDHGGTVVFASHSRKVDKMWNGDACDCEYIDRHVHRAPAFDKYAPGPVTTKHYLTEGWYWCCHSCGDHLNGEDEPLVTDDDNVYCDTDCMLKHLTQCKQFGHKSWRISEASIMRYLETSKQESMP